MHQIMMKLEATDLVCSGGRILINFDFDKGKIILILKKFKYKSTFWRCQMLFFFYVHIQIIMGAMGPWKNIKILGA